MARRRLHFKRHDEVWLGRKARAEEMVEEMRLRLLSEFRIELRVRMPRAGKTSFPHWCLYDDEDRQVLQFWPTTMMWRHPWTGRWGELANLEDLLQVLRPTQEDYEAAIKQHLG